MKTEFVAAKTPVEFLGLEILFKERQGQYVCQIPKNVRSTIQERIHADYSLANAMEEHKTITRYARAISGVPDAYANAYGYADDWPDFQPHVESACRTAMASISSDIFGGDRLAQLNQQQRQFLGLEKQLR